MKLLFSHYQYFVLRLETLAFSFGYIIDVGNLLCKYLQIKGKPAPTRKYITTPEMKRLVDFCRGLLERPSLFLRLLGLV